jgi:hypothetical protein
MIASTQDTEEFGVRDTEAMPDCRAVTQCRSAIVVNACRNAAATLRYGSTVFAHAAVADGGYKYGAIVHVDAPQ